MEDIDIDLLQCPKCGGSLEKIDKNLVICDSCKEKYFIKDGILVLLPDLDKEKYFF